MILTDTLHWVHPLVRDWFYHRFCTPTEPQIQGWPLILANKPTLISAPTGSGKTFAAFLVYIDYLVRKALVGQLKDQTEVLYVSPLKALSNDIQKNLAQPLYEIAQLAEKRGQKISDIRVAVRTGDTLARERQAMLKKPPHILVTTPESLYILLTAEKSRAILRDVKTVIIDEIHALANDKRGAHLSLSLERLEAITSSPLVRIGLSATQKPIELVARFLIGNRRIKATQVNVGHRRDLDLRIEVPGSELGSIASNEMWDEIYDRIALLAAENRSTLVFVNTRRLAERMAHRLAERLGEDKVAAHHGSLSRQLRLSAESQLKNGELKVLVATASLELGIDIGTIDLVCQIGSPRAIAVALQRIGRAGHWRGAISKGCFFAGTRDELLECAALIYAIRQGDLDRLIIPQAPMDILAQQIVAACATSDWKEVELFKLIKRAYPYKDLTLDEYNSILEMLSEGVSGTRGRYGTFLFRDRVNGMLKARRNARLTAITCGGAIPENGLFTVIAQPEGNMVGTLDEDFAVESNRGDIILLGTTSWRIIRVESASGRVLVEDAKGAPPSVPFWRGEAPARTDELSGYVSNLREKINDLLSSQNSPCLAITWLKANTGLDHAGAEQIIEYILKGRAVLGAVPTQTTIIAERFFDEAGGMQLVIHAPFGARINKAWGLALRKKFCRSFNFELQASATDDGLNIALAEQHSFPLSDVFQFLHSNTVKEVLIQAILQSPLFTTRWRWTATRSLALLRFRNGKKVAPHVQRILSDDLLAAVFPSAAACQDNLGGHDIELPDHPLINETMKDILTEALDIEGLISVLQGMHSGKILCIAVDTPTPSVFSHEILNANPYAFLDDAPLEERRARAVEMRRVLPESVLQEVGKLDPLAVADVQEQAWPDIRNVDELHDMLQTFIAFPKPQWRESWTPFLETLIQEKRAGIAQQISENKIYYICAEKVKTFLSIYPGAKLQQQFAEVEANRLGREEAIVKMIQGWMLHLGPVTATELSQRLNLAESEITQALLKCETTGFLLRGHFRSDAVGETQWCERRLLARIHRLTLGKLRKEIEPVSAAVFMRWLLKWQHLAPQTQLRGEKGLIEIISQLQGIELPAKAWEKDIFSKRLTDYGPHLLDRLCLTGMIGWGRIITQPACEKRVRPNSASPISFFIREQPSSWKDLKEENDLSKKHEGLILSHGAKCIYLFLEQRGASFFIDILHAVGLLKSETEAALWELVAAGLITADSFDNLRSLIDPRRRLKQRRFRGNTFLGSSRWFILSEHKTSDTEETCWRLLKRYGVVFRDLLAREKNLPTWRELLIAFRRLEERGEIRGGRFVDGFLGEQFALPYAVDSLRIFKKQPPENEKITLAATDPLNLIGIILPGERIPSITGKKITL